MIGYWDHFPAGLITCITAIGGLLGVVRSVPLRRALILESDLSFPEGVATAEVLQAGEAHREGGNSSSIKGLVWGGFIASLLKFLQTGLQLFTESFEYWFFAGSTVAGFGGGFSAAVIGGGYIVGFHAVISMLSGGLLSWVVGVLFMGF